MTLLLTHPKQLRTIPLIIHTSMMQPQWLDKQQHTPDLSQHTNTKQYSSPLSKQQDIRRWKTNQSSQLNSNEASFLQPYGHELQPIDSRTTFQIIMQNP
jgi:hypothetical protein